MAYSTNSEISGEFKGITFSSTTTPNTTDIDRFITEADAEINARVGMKYSVPITLGASPIAFAILRQISVQLVAGRMKRILEVKQTSPDLAKQDGQSKDIAKIARDMLKEIVLGTLPLPDATLLSSGDGVSSSNVSAGREHFFSMDEDQW
jgi:hypothetical protein